MIEPPGPISGNAFLDREDRALHIGVEGFVNVLGGDLAERKRASRPGIGEDDIEASALGLHRSVEPVEVGLIRDRALHRAGIGPELHHSGVERFLAAAEDEDEGPLVDEALCRGAADAGGATGDDGGLSIQSGHVVQSPCFAVSSLWLLKPLAARIGLRDAQDGSAGGRRSVRKRAHRWCEIDPAGRLMSA